MMSLGAVEMRQHGNFAQCCQLCVCQRLLSSSIFSNLEVLLHPFHVIRLLVHMVFTKACRLTLDELDGNWGHKFRLRVALNVLCGLSIGACAYALSQRPTFQSEAWIEDHEILLYLPYVRISIGPCC
jgi:hypothetical protein